MKLSVEVVDAVQDSQAGGEEAAIVRSGEEAAIVRSGMEATIVRIERTDDEVTAASIAASSGEEAVVTGAMENEEAEAVSEWATCELMDGEVAVVTDDETDNEEVVTPS